MKPQTLTVKYQQVEPEPIWLDFEGTHIKITGPLAFLYNAFKVVYCEERARQELQPWLMAVKAKTATAPQQIAAQTAR